MAQVKFFRGTKAQYDAAFKKNKEEVKNSVFFVTDEHCIMMNETQYGGVDNAMFNGFIKDVDVEGNVLSFKKDVEGTWTDVSIKLLEAADNSIVVGDITKEGGVKDGSTIRVNVKAVGDADGLKLGTDGLYVDLTKTTSSITTNTQAIADEIARAKAAEQANADNITKLNADATTAGSVDNKIDTAIKGLDVNSIGGEGKFVKSVSETDGKIAAEVGDLVSTAVTRTATTNVAGQVDMSGTTVEGALVDLAKAVSETKKGAATYKIKKVTEGLAANVKEAYQLVQTVNGVASDIDVQIPIYKDQTLKSVELADKDGSKKGQYLKYTYITAEGKDSVVYVDVSKFLVESEFKNGLSVSESGEVSVKIDATSEGFLTVGTNGVKLSGVTAAINSAKTEIIGGATNTTLKALEDKLADEADTARAAEKANAAAIEVLNGADTVNGSVAKAVADAKKELLGDAAAEYNTLGKLENKIQALDDKATKAHTEVGAKADGHVRVAVADSTDGTHKVVTISENDIASASALTAEVTRAKAAEDTIEASVGLAANGSHVKATGNYTKNATTVVGEISALDTQVKANADNITTISGNVTTNTSDIDKLKKTVSGHTTSINTLNGEETALGSVKHTAKGYADNALAKANAHTDEALSWIEAGNY